MGLGRIFFWFGGVAVVLFCFCAFVFFILILERLELFYGLRKANTEEKAEETGVTNTATFHRREGISIIEGMLHLD